MSDQISLLCGQSRPFFTLEFFPPRTDQGFDNLVSRISRLALLNPLAVSVTWGAGGSTKARSIELATLTQSDHNLTTLLHLTCTNAELGQVDAALQAAHKSGIQNILALRGDPPRGQEEWAPSDPRFQHAIDLVKYIRETRGNDFCIGVAAYPDDHPDRLLNTDTEIDNLKAKVDAGADFIITQLFYDVDGFLVWLHKVRHKGINVPIIPGVMPIQTYGSFQRLTQLTGAKVPVHVQEALKHISHDDQQVKDYGVSLAVDMIRRLVSEANVPGVHFCTLNLEKSVQRVLETLQWTDTLTHPHNRLIAGTPDNPPPVGDIDLVVTATAATHDATQSLASNTVTEGDASRGEFHNAASWDDFPNGRFGDFKSPAFGAADLWGNSGVAINEMLRQWRHPKTLSELTQIFLDYLHSKISNTPFSPAPLSPESLIILPELEQLTQKSWWTVGSQPAINGISSSDETVGWGPKAGYLFQKGFVEFFCDEADVELLEQRIEKKGKGWVHYIAGSHKGGFKTNVSQNGRNAVTWGVFPGQEIIQTTIIEHESFLSWKEEAFSTWSDWASCYRPGSDERKLLESVRDQRWLINIIHHDYQNPRALWDIILGESDINSAEA